MSEVKDPSIKLFGKTIQRFDALLHHDKLISSSKDPRTPDSSAEELIGQETSSGMTEDPKIPNDNKETVSLETDNKEDQSDLSNSDGKTLKKPDKLLPCPRCNSMDTKFCYYNNYNISQPRHFCKGCHRYWTAGGTMRNVPVGSGRRKSKSSTASLYRHILTSDAVQVARAEAANRINHPTASVLTFGSEPPLCESMASSLFLANKSQNCVKIGFNSDKQQTPVTYRNGENADDYSCGSSSTVPNPIEKGFSGGPESVLPTTVQGSPVHVPCFPMPPWPYPWNNAVQWRPQTPPTTGPSVYPVSFYPPPPYWGCMVPNSWNMPYPSQQPSSPNHPALRSSPNSLTLGKHSRDGGMLRPSQPGMGDPLNKKDPIRRLLVPKTLRINQSIGAAQSSKWPTLGIKTGNTDSGTGASLTNAFLPRATKKNHIMETSQVLQANPAAMTRSSNFHETT
ncbi:hypothetical protein DCAR_0208082 [Daucus carota subsp. sativus]|uniref:Dof-type domain-containing protein n=1 Tax=Daucus carota subsp. sativus TaxID=79200 RepID=A0AAF1AQ75_DAUCS|nr:hypothetical protein DCAR_0208082 [Daucus carota subsp. sativus]